ncbi:MULTISPECIES: MarR family winged helix-turn-helix transcriptional regulator [unclassified Bradyrhizobium]|uniref:MarR family winged helix-turn-helix transcriptional regulator n=1 Tax=unclassified Bradyrhizobium TaxID=2631580 RepID=UPI0013E1310A|nr:MarR family transcriptional regulator [Bradyrhizobium sp. 6(2017)]QIG94892.1 MarR family transcriptional regulator [Bradyrhizobium sp. 6(2017)]
MPAAKKLEVEEASNDRSRTAGTLAREHLAVLVSTIGMRLNRGATAYYRSAWNIGAVEWRLIMTLKSISSLNVSELSDAADIDKAAASRSLAILEERGLVSVEQTRSRGRAAIAKLTAEGRKFAVKLTEVSRERDARLFKEFTPSDKERLRELLNQLSHSLEKADWEH